jgi:hypothetical protein
VLELEVYRRTYRESRKRKVAETTPTRFAGLMVDSWPNVLRPAISVPNGSTKGLVSVRGERWTAGQEDTAVPEKGGRRIIFILKLQAHKVDLEERYSQT